MGSFFYGPFAPRKDCAGGSTTVASMVKSAPYDTDDDTEFFKEAPGREGRGGGRRTRSGCEVPPVERGGRPQGVDPRLSRRAHRRGDGVPDEAGPHREGCRAHG